ncbi:MAG TPA: hypothetical protein VMV22_14430 [Acidimicrobiales bacterium]|nr:hypothetical protein [Acidimicrobiales bacterium]
MNATDATMTQAVPGAERAMPPVAGLALATLAFVIAAGIYLAAHLPRPAPGGPAATLIAIGGVLLVVNAAIVSRIRPFAWTVFRRVFGWTFLAYGCIGALLAFIFIFDHTRGAMLGAMLASLVVFTLDIPLLFAFSVARYQDPG